MVHLVFAAILGWAALPVGARLNMDLLSRPNQSFESLLPKNMPERQSVLEGLHLYFQFQPRLQDVLRAPRIEFWEIRLPHEGSSKQGSNPPWTHALQTWLADEGFSLDLTLEGLQKMRDYPQSILWRSVSKADFSPECTATLQSIGIYTLYDLFRGFPSGTEFKAFLAQLREVKGRKLEPKSVSKLENAYAKVRTQFMKELRKRNEPLSNYASGSRCTSPWKM